MNAQGIKSRTRVATVLTSSAVLFCLVIVAASALASVVEPKGIAFWLGYVAAVVMVIASIIGIISLMKPNVPNSNLAMRLPLLLLFALSIAWVLVPLVSTLKPEIRMRLAVFTFAIMMFTACVATAFPVKGDWGMTILGILLIITVGHLLWFMFVDAPLPKWWLGTIIVLFSAISYYDSSKVYLGASAQDRNVAIGTVSSVMDALNIFTAMAQFAGD